MPERVLETLHYLADEIDQRRVGGLGEAQAAGYIAGRLRRAEQQAVVLPFRCDAPPWAVLALVIGAVVLAWVVPLVLPLPPIQAASPVLVALAVGLFWNEQAGSGAVSQLLGRRTSQSVVGVRAAGGSQAPRCRAIVLAPLDGPPRSMSRRLSRGVLGLLIVQVIVYSAALVVAWPWWQPLLAALALLTVGLLLRMLGRQRLSLPQPGSLGAGELAALVGVAEEVGPLQHAELWTVAVGAGALGDAGLRQLLRRYPFDQHTVIVNLHRITSGVPVIVTREGVVRERRTDRNLFMLASTADAHDARINAEPRPLPRRTLAHLALYRGLRAVTMTSQPEPVSTKTTPSLPSLEVATITRCVYLAVGLLHELDQQLADK